MCPRIETPRLRLRAHREEDFADIAAMWADPAVVRHVTGVPSTPKESWFRMLRYRGLWSVLGFGYWCVRDRDTGRYVGDVGFADFRRETEPSIAGLPEAGWVLASWAQGGGRASEAVGAALRWLDRETAHREAVCLIARENGASARIAAKHGFAAAGVVTLDAVGIPLWRRDRPAEPQPAEPRTAEPRPAEP